MNPPRPNPTVALHSARRWAARVRDLATKPFIRKRARPFSDYIAFRQTLKAARAAGVSVGEYIERKHVVGPQTALDLTMDGLAALGVFNDPIETVCEIGPGSGRYLEKVAARSRPKLYEIYETSKEWRTWLVGKYGVAARICDGRTLGQTEADSVGLVHAHKVFPGLPFLTVLSYLREMARVARDGGWVVFDVMTEACFGPDQLDAWFKAAPWDWPWTPHLMSRDYAVNVFAERGVVLVGSFRVPLFPATTECMVFRKTDSPRARAVP